MRMFAVADSVFSVCDVDGMVRHHLDVLSVQDAVLFLSDHVLDSGLLGGEIVSDLLHGVGFSSLFHHRLSLYDACRVLGSTGEKCLCLKVILHVIGCQFHICIGNADVAIIVDYPLSIAEIFDNRVLCRSECRGIQRTLVQKVERICT